MKPYLITGLVCLLVGAAAMLLLMHGCQSPPPHQQDKAAVDSTARDSAFRRLLEDSIEHQAGRLMEKDDMIENLNRQLYWYDAQLADANDEIDATKKQLDSARENRDTAQFVRSCDTLELQVGRGQAQVLLYKGTVDSLMGILARKSQLQDSIAASWRSAYLHADTAAAMIKTKYDLLYLDYAKQNARLKLSSNTGKVLGGAAAALLIGLLLKK